MGLRMSSKVNFLPAYVKDGLLYCDKLLDKPIQLPKGIPDFPLQLNQVNKSNIACYLRNDDGMELVIRFTKSGCLVQNKFLRSSFLLDSWPFYQDYTSNIVAYVDTIDGQKVVVRRINYKDSVDIISCNILPVTVVMNDYANSRLCKYNRAGVQPVLYLQRKSNKLVYSDSNELVEGIQYSTVGMSTLGGYNYGKD